MWQVYESSEIDRIFHKLPREVRVRYEKWKDIVRLSGSEGLRQIKGFHDEKRKGAWDGFRSSRLGEKYRVIYKIERDRLLVKVFRVTPHDYRR